MTVSGDVSRVRLYCMRALYTLNFAALGIDVWPRLINHVAELDPMSGVAYSFWAALSALSGLGLRYPLRMLPLLLLQLVYKGIWLITVSPSLWPITQSAGLTRVFLLGLVLDVAIIPWRHVLKQYVKEPGDRWR